MLKTYSFPSQELHSFITKITQLYLDSSVRLIYPHITFRRSVDHTFSLSQQTFNMLTESAAEMGLYSGKWSNYLKSLNLIMYSVRVIYIQQRTKIQD